MQSLLRGLRVLQHVLLLVLVGVCLAQALRSGTSPVAVSAATAAFLGWYGAGVLAARRPGAPATGAGWGGRAVLWLGGLTAGWLLLVALSAQFAWIAFSLWLLAGHFFRWRWSIPYTVLTLAVLAVAQWWPDGSLTVAEVLGPSVGAAFALVASRTQDDLVQDSLERQELLASLVTAQAQADALSAELAATQRDSGIAAERARLSRDIHDTLAQGFSSIVLLARSAEVTADGELRDLLTRIDETAADNLAEARRVVAALAPRDLAAGLPASVRRLLDTFAAQTGLRTTLHVDGHVDGLPTPVEVALVRTTQGALANVRQHARASRVVVSLTDDGDVVRLDIADDGIGFTPSDTPRTTIDGGGYGLPSTRARLRELGGGLDVESAPGEGTVLSAHVPLTTRPTL